MKTTLRLTPTTSLYQSSPSQAIPGNPLLAEWTTIKQQVGFFGRQKKFIYAEFDKQYGEGNWRIAWQVGDRAVQFDEAITLYEEAYRQYLTKHPEIVQYLVENGSEVYDNNISNIHSGTYYKIQEASSTHLQDISIRKIIVEMGLQFKGKTPIQLRPYAKDKIGKKLHPGAIPFHKRELIAKPSLSGWWKPGTIEDFWQSNKVLQVRRNSK